MRTSLRRVLWSSGWLAALAWPLRPAAAQWSDLVIGSEVDRYLRARAVLGASETEPQSLRQYTPSAVAALRRDTSRVGAVWRDRFAVGADPRWELIPLEASVALTTARPWSWLDGPVWAGRGVTTAMRGGVVVGGARWHVRLDPQLVMSENRAFDLTGDSEHDPMRAGVIDLPQRFGATRYTRLEWGQSEVRVDALGASVALSTRNLHWGPGVRHAVLFTAQGAGFPHLSVGTALPVRTPLGRFSGQMVWGRLRQSSQAPAVVDSTRLGTGLKIVFEPAFARGIELGVSRFYHRQWPDSPLSARVLTSPFGSLFVDEQNDGGGGADNQVASFTGRWRAPEGGFEVFGEFARNDRSIDTRDVLLELEHNSAWLLGAARTVVTPKALWMVRAEFINGRSSPPALVNRDQATFYEHSPLHQGHTQRGQLLGSPLLERTGGAEIGVDRWTAQGRMSAMLFHRLMPFTRAGEQAVADSAGVQWGGEVSGLWRLRPGLDATGAATLIVDRAAQPGERLLNLQLRAGLRYAR